MLVCADKSEQLPTSDDRPNEACPLELTILVLYTSKLLFDTSEMVHILQSTGVEDRGRCRKY